jgi:20S proteasome alpha/beta subunit
MKMALNCNNIWLNSSRYCADPSGTSMRFDAKAIGAGSEGAQAEIQEQYHKVRF